MIASLRGTLLERGEGFVVVEAGGVGYQVHVTTGTLVSRPGPGDGSTRRVCHHAVTTTRGQWSEFIPISRSIFTRGSRRV